MEARSLASINYLAGNPPQYPVNPSEQRQEPLTLYLSRVPGTRDVILSPFKPQLKNVTGEDVTNSLYYVHLEMPSSQPARMSEDRGRSSDESFSARTIPRKPLPGSAKNLSPERSPERSPVDPENQASFRNRGQSLGAGEPTCQAPPPPFHAEDSGLGLNDYAPEPKSRLVPELKAPIPRKPTVTRKPIGPRSEMNTTSTAQGPAITREAAIREMNQTPPRKSITVSRSPSPKKTADSPFSTPFTLTLIRRDPSSGNQWNVGRISSYQTEPPSADQDETGAYFPSARPMSPPTFTSARPPINIQIDTLGYAKFRNMPPKKSLDAGQGGFLGNAPVTMCAEDVNQPKNGAFTRQVMMSYSKSWTSHLKEKLQQRAEQGGFGKPRASYEHRRNGSAASNESVKSNGEVPGQPGPKMKPRGYVFTSPWDARCEFRTGNGGRSLRCYHLLHDERNSTFNPLVAEQEGPGAPQAGAMPVSELRFNLPGADLFKSPDGHLDAKTQIQGHFNKLFKMEARDYSDEEDDGMVSPFDMNLGKEKAGGGNRGKRAKLGKLIIYPDGLKMLDLVVAANVGVWWGAWERSY